MPNKEKMDATGNSAVYRKLYRRYLDDKYLICSYCPPNAGENASGGKPSRSWKRYRKNQYRMRMI